MARYTWGEVLVNGKFYLIKKGTIPKAQLLLQKYLTTAQFLLNMRLYVSPQIVELLKGQNLFVGHENPK